jgi:hypothetical protein
MPANTLKKPELSDNPIRWFLLCWTIFNAIQAYTLEVHADEAYYWMYSKFMDWGYFDHPPMVALFIWLGDHVMHNELGLRLVTVLTSTIAIYLLWLMLKKYLVDAWLFILVISGMLIIHMYGFTTTPDAPLFFFTIVFYYLYQKYIEEDSWLLATLLGVVLACLMYSKYHAILVIGLTLASNIKLLKRGTFWGIVAIAILLFVPHIIWQFQHSFPSFRYHLYDRSATIYNPENTYTYIPGQLLMAGPVIGWFLFYSAFKIKVKDAFIRGLLVNCVGAFIFFLLSTFRGEAQPHWTLIAFAPLAMLALIRFNQVKTIPRWFYSTALINVVLIVFIRVSLMFGFAFVSKVGQLKSYYGFKDWAGVVKSHAGNNYVIMSDGFQNPSKYNYYTNSIRAYSYDSRNYRATQYDIWPIEEQFQGQQVYFLQDVPQEETVDTITNTFIKANWYAQWVYNARTYQKITIEADVQSIRLVEGQSETVELTVTNPYPYPVSFSNASRQNVFLEACFFKDDATIAILPADNSFYNLNLKPGESKKFNFSITAPAIEKGNYELLFSIRTTPFSGGKNSRVIPFTLD